MNCLIDTNVISELAKAIPAPSVSRFADVNEGDLCISVVTLAAIRFGIASMDQGRRRQAFELWLANDIPQRFAGRILDVTPSVATAWGDVMALSQRRGANVQAMDGLLAATAQAFGLTLVTRNIRDFDRLDISLLDPWQSA